MSKAQRAPGMEPKHMFDAIDQPTFEWVLQHYGSLLTAQDEGDHLDRLRYQTIPYSVKERSQDSHLDKEELVELVTWKLKHGTFRPALKSLVQQNDSKKVEETSRQGFAAFNGGKPKDAIKILTELKGIGPATASLMLSVYDPAKAPFFSDELFRWAFFESGKGNGWDRRIKYTAKEYVELYDKVQQLLERLSIEAVDAEKVAYVLGKDSPTGASAREKVGKSSKRKAEELDCEVAVMPGTTTNATTGKAGSHEAANPELKSRGVPDSLPSDDERVYPAKETVKQESSSSPQGRPKRKNRKQ